MTGLQGRLYLALAAESWWMTLKFGMIKCHRESSVQHGAARW